MCQFWSLLRKWYPGCDYRGRQPAGFCPLGRTQTAVPGHPKRSKMKKQKGFSLIELLIVVAIILIIAAIAIPNLLRAKIAANDASAVGSMRTIVTAEDNYQNTHTEAGFTCSLSDLSGLIDPGLATGQRSGYAFSLQDCATDAAG